MLDSHGAQRAFIHFLSLGCSVSLPKVVTGGAAAMPTVIVWKYEGTEATKHGEQRAWTLTNNHTRQARHSHALT